MEEIPRRLGARRMARRRIQRVVADSLAPLTPGVEVAAYRIAVEALTNAARHSGGPPLLLGAHHRSVAAAGYHR
jgi:signal transduction histidine kinase